MISLLLLVLTVMMSAIVTRFGAIALEITGLQEEHAGFQALSAYSGVGFTTRESEFTLNHPNRRKIIKTLMRLGAAGVITTMATLVGAMASSKDILHTVLDGTPLGWLPLNCTEVILLGVVLVFYGMQRLLSQPAVSRLLKELIVQFLVEEHWVSPVKYHEVLTQANGYGVVQVEVCDSNPMLGKTASDPGLVSQGITLLSLERLQESYATLPPEMTIQVGDRLVCYGPLHSVQQSCCVSTRGTWDRQNDKALKDAPLPVGLPAPDFTLTDQIGHPWTLSELRGKSHVVLIFYPKDKSYTCSSQLRRFGNQVEALASIGAQVVAINPAPPKTHADFAKSLAVDFALLSDPGSKVSRTYRSVMLWGLLVNRTVYVIDKEGVVRYAKRGNPSILDVAGIIRALNQPSELVSSTACTT